MNARKNYEFDGGNFTCFFKVSEGAVYNMSYPEDRKALHEAHAGKQYYESQSGLSGAGYFDEDIEDLLEIGWYRTDAGKGHQYAGNPVYNNGNWKLWYYAPVLNINNLSYDEQARFNLKETFLDSYYLTDGSNVMPVRPEDLGREILGWKETIDGKEDRHEKVRFRNVYFDQRLVEMKKVYTFLSHRDYQPKGGFLRFTDFFRVQGKFQEAIEAQGWTKLVDDQNVYSRKLENGNIKLWFLDKNGFAREQPTAMEDDVLTRVLKSRDGMQTTITIVTSEGALEHETFEEERKGLQEVNAVEDFIEKYPLYEYVCTVSVFSPSTDAFENICRKIRADAEDVIKTRKKRINLVQAIKSSDLVISFKGIRRASKTLEKLGIGESVKASELGQREDLNEILDKRNIRNAIENALSKAEVVERLKEAGDMFFSREDSHAVGNCQGGTDSFMKEYNLDDGVTAAKLLKHEKLNEMLEDNQFVRVLKAKFAEKKDNGKM